jgi:type IV pilus assembly protein PilF
LGLVYEQLGDLEGAEIEFRTAVKQAPEDPDALNQLGSYLCLHGDTSEALKYFDRGILVPRNQDRYLIFTNAGTCAKDVDLALAEDYLRRGLAENSRFSDALFQMGEVAYRRKNYLQARAFIERRMAASKAAPDALWLGYKNEVALNDTAAADRFAGQLLGEFPTSVEARMLLDSRRNGG